MDGSGFGPRSTVGASADYDAKAAILDALTESLSVRLGIKNSFRQEIDPAQNRPEGKNNLLG